MGVQRWWETTALKVGLDLSAGLGTVPDWIFQDSEARRIGIGAGVRSASVGGAFTARVLLEGIAGLLPGSQTEVAALLGQGMEGPLWLDIGKDGTWVEGAIFNPRGGAGEWLEDVRAQGLDIFGALDPDGRLLQCQGSLPSASVGGMRLGVGAIPALELILQQPLGRERDCAAVAEALGELGQICALAPGDMRALTESVVPFLGPKATLMDVILPTVGAGLQLRFWNVSKEASRQFLREAGAQEGALERFDGLMAHAQCVDIARVCLRFKPGRAPGLRFLVDLGLAEY